MSDNILFKIDDHQVTELTGSAAKIEKLLQSQMKANLENEEPLILKSYEGS